LKRRRVKAETAATGQPGHGAGPFLARGSVTGG
jgi:hypothetical protein